MQAAESSCSDTAASSSPANDNHDDHDDHDGCDDRDDDLDDDQINTLLSQLLNYKGASMMHLVKL